jgi:hypothetical protein
LFYSPDPGVFYAPESSAEAAPADLIESFSAVKYAGGPESHRIFVKAFNQNLFYALFAVDDEGNAGQLSNIVKAYMPQPFVIGQTGQSVRHSGQLREGLFNPFEVINEPNKVIMYVVVGVVTVVIFTFLVVMLIMLLLRKAGSRNRGRPTSAELAGQEDDLYTTKESDLVRFGSVDINLHHGGEDTASGSKLPKYIISNHHQMLHIDHYGEYAGPPSPHPPSSNFSSEDRLFPPSGQSSSGSHHSMVTFIDPSTYHQQLEPSTTTIAAAADEYAARPCSPIYSRPLPRILRSGLVQPDSVNNVQQQQQHHPSPGKSILKKPLVMSSSSAAASAREEGDGEAAEVNLMADHLYTTLPVSPSSYLETNLDMENGCGVRREGPPTLPKPLLCLDVTQHSDPELPQLRNLDVLPEHLVQAAAVAAPDGDNSRYKRPPPDRQVRPTDSADRRVRNCTQV